MRSLDNLYVVVHSPYSVARLVEAARIAYGYGVTNFIVSKAMGAAAQEGVPEVYKMALKMKKNLIFLADLEDVLEVIKPSEVLLFVSKHHAKAEFKPDTVVEMLRRGEKVVLIFGGAEPGLTKRDLEKGQPVYVKVPGDIGPLGTMAIVLYLLYKGLTSRESP